MALKSLFKTYTGVILFIVKLLLSYTILSFFYRLYLKYYKDSVDGITYFVAKKSAAILEYFEYNVELITNFKGKTVALIVNDQLLSRVVEGCNAISVIILFTAFIIAFSGTFKHTVLYIMSGSIFIFSINILRITLINMGLYHYPEHSAVLHDVIFPATIYGLVFLLWMFWLKLLKRT